MTHYNLAQVATEIAIDSRLEIISKPTLVAKVATEVKKSLESKVAAIKDQNAEWHRVNSYIADILKDAHVLYAKLARLQGDFAETELDKLEHVSEKVLELGSELSSFSKGFYEGRIEMVKEFSYSGPGGSTKIEVETKGDEVPVEGESKDPEPSHEELDIDLDLEGETDFIDYEVEKEGEESKEEETKEDEE